MDLQGYFDDLPEYLEFDIIGEATHTKPEMDYFDGTGWPGGWVVDIYAITILGVEFHYKDMPKDLQKRIDDLQQIIAEKLENE
jgi:hypothetical protein